MRATMLVIVVSMVAAGCSSTAATTTTTAAVTTTTAAVTTTTAAVTTTTAAVTTTTTDDGEIPVAATPIVADLQPYNEQGADLFPSGSVQAHWYQWNGLYVVLYRGFDASSGTPICAGNSIQAAAGFTNISNSPFGATAGEICDGVPKLADPPSGAFSCGSLLYYVTEIPSETVGNLFGTLEIVQDAATVVYGQTSSVLATIDQTPEFEPGLAAYQLPASSTEGPTSVICG